MTDGRKIKIIGLSMFFGIALPIIGMLICPSPLSYDPFREKLSEYMFFVPCCISLGICRLLFTTGNGNPVPGLLLIVFQFIIYFAIGYMIVKYLERREKKRNPPTDNLGN